MASAVSQLVQEVTVHAQSDSLEDARDIFADGTYFPNNLRTSCHITELFLSDVPRIRESCSVLCCSWTSWLVWLWCAPQRSKSQW